MYKSLLIIFALVYSLAGIAQKGVYEDLLVMYVDEQYEKCLGKAESYTLKESTKRDPLPYLYMSMCFFEMSKLEKFDEDYPKAFRSSLKYASKYRKKDKDDEFFGDYEDFWIELNTTTMEVGENYFDEGDYSKAKRYYKYMTEYDRDNPGAWLMRVHSELKSNMARDAELNIVEFNKALKKQGSLDGLSPDREELLRTALIKYSEYLVETGRSDSAKKTMDIGSDAFLENEEFKMVWDELN